MSIAGRPDFLKTSRRRRVKSTCRRSAVRPGSPIEVVPVLLRDRKVACPMPFKSTRLPKYRHYKPKDLAVVRIDGRDFYLGKFGSQESKEKYRRLLAERLASPAPAPPAQAAPHGQTGVTVNELIVAYWDRHVVSYYVKSARPTSEQ